MRAIKKKEDEGIKGEREKAAGKRERERKIERIIRASLMRARERTQIINIFLLCPCIKNYRDDEAQRETTARARGQKGSSRLDEAFQASGDISVNLSAEP